MAIFTDQIADMIAKLAKIILAGYENTGDKGDYEAAQADVKFFLESNIQRIVMWDQTNPGQRLPVYYLMKERKVVWLSRKQRRKLAIAATKDQQKRA